MQDRKFAIPDPTEPDPLIASLVRWAKAVGGIRSVSISVYQADGRSITECADLVLGTDNEDR
ncbi:hypothetical protein [Sphingobium amiense]|uniref:hypothetical protein n=1 Tax=Sphingobium amiense TaxID=135719 RepID=UPI00082FD9EC|nr:hypothetical protein [Sphingobium amiense]